MIVSACINWVTQMSFKPPLIAIGVKADSGAHAIIETTKEFVLNNLGKDGKGATRAGRTAGVKDFTDPAYQKEITDAKAIDQIKNGMKDKDGKEKMKAYKDELSAAEIKDLVAYVRKFKP